MFGWFGRWLVILGFWEDKVSLGRTGDIAVPNDRVRAYYEGEVDTADYWDPDNMGDCDIVVLLPHGFGKLTYRVEGEVLETYEG
jgi:hypothetical protein